MYVDGGAAVLLDPPPAYTSQRTTGTITGTGQAYVLRKPSVADPGLPAVILCHNAQSDNYTPTGGGIVFGDSFWIAAGSDYLAQRGFCVISPDMYGDQWGSDLGNQGINEALDYLHAHTNADTSRIFMWGLSLGGEAIASYLANAITAAGRTCLAAYLQVPVVDLGYMHDNGFANAIDGAYGSHANYLAQYHDRDPTTLAADGRLNGVPIQVSWGSSDTAVCAAGNACTLTYVDNLDEGVLGPDVLIHFGSGLAYGPGIASWMVSHLPEYAAQRTLLT